jgi:hypothetical protein
MRQGEHQRAEPAAFGEAAQLLLVERILDDMLLDRRFVDDILGLGRNLLGRLQQRLEAAASST